MQKNFIRTVSIVLMIALMLTVLVIFGLQTQSSKTDALATEKVQVQQVKKRVEDNAAAIVSLTDSINADSLAKTKAFAFMIEQNPAILENAAQLDRVKNLLGVDELHVTDEKGVLSWGTEPTMFGFDFATNDQTRPFLDGLQNKSFELAQEAQLNATKGILFQYIGVARPDKTGVVQIGMRPERLESALENNEIANVLSGIRVGKNGYIFAARRADGLITAHPNTALIGKTAQEIGLPEHFLSDAVSQGFAKIDGGAAHFYAEVQNDLIIGAAMPREEVFGRRNLLTLIFAASIALLFLILIYCINRLLKRQIINGLHAISASLSRISAGDLDVEVNVTTNQEFSLLSDGINHMVASIHTKIKEAQQLSRVEQQLFVQVRDTTGIIHDVSRRMLSVSDSLENGTGEQGAAARALSVAFGEVTQQIGETAERAQNARSLAVEMKERLHTGNVQMDEMVTSMNQINTHSQKISSIIKSIDSIAFQTNILALNAAVEAARAGVAGKGFAVVADEVRNLAGKSAQSAKDTADLIAETLQTVEIGTQKVTLTAETLSEIIETAQQSAELIDGISGATDEQKRLVSGVGQEIDHISSVVQANTATAQESASAAQELSTQAQSLYQLVQTRQFSEKTPAGQDNA